MSSLSCGSLVGDFQVLGVCPSIGYDTDRPLTSILGRVLRSGVEL
ncbi:hypothetical protein [Microcoleus sp. Pol11C3]